METKKYGNFYKENSGCSWRKLEIYLPNINLTVNLQNANVNTWQDNPLHCLDSVNGCTTLSLVSSAQPKFYILNLLTKTKFKAKRYII